MKKNIIIIGAGPAGLSAGYKLIEKGYNVTILEESNAIGGISKTVNYKGNRMDIGGHRFFTKDEEVFNFWLSILPIQGKKSYDDKKLKIEKDFKKGGPDPEKEDKVLLIRNRVSRIYYKKKFFDYPVTLKLDTFKNMGLWDTICCGFSYLKIKIFKKKEDSLENFYINRFGKKLYSMFFEKYTEKVWGVHPRNISPDWGSQRAKGLSIFGILKDMLAKKFSVKNKNVETSLIETFYYPKFGPGQMYETLAQKFEDLGGKILKNHKVINIHITDKHIDSVDCLVNGETINIKGDIFISSMPIKDLINDFDNEVPSKIKKITDNLPYRDFVTIGLLVNKINLKNKTNIKTLSNIIPDDWIYVQEPDVKLGRIQVFNNWSPYMVKDVNNTIWLGLEYFCNENDKFWNKTDKQLEKLAIKELVKMQIINDEDVLDAHVEKVKKAYPAYFVTYEHIDKVIKYLNKFDNLYCIGRNGQHRYNNMDHSVLTGIKAANVIMGIEKDKKVIWEVNTEKEYHEIKKEN